MDALFDRSPSARPPAPRSTRSRPVAFGFEVLDQARQRVGAAIEDEIVAELADVGVDLEVRRDLFGMDERAIEPGLDAMMQEDRVERRARVRASGRTRRSRRRATSARPAARA